MIFHRHIWKDEDRLFMVEAVPPRRAPFPGVIVTHEHYAAQKTLFLQICTTCQKRRQQEFTGHYPERRGE